MKSYPKDVCRRCPSVRTKQAAFTLVELLSVVAIITILSALAAVGLGKVRDQSRQTASKSNLRQLALAMSLFTVDNKGKLPTTYTNDPGYVGWDITVLPYLNLTSRIEKSQVFSDPTAEARQSGVLHFGMNLVLGRGRPSDNPGWFTDNRQIGQPSRRILLATCGLDPNVSNAWAHFDPPSWGLMWGGNPQAPMPITDGAGQTPYGVLGQIHYRYSGTHAGVAMADYSVRSFARGTITTEMIGYRTEMQNP